jgi:hypothetical protein
VGGEILVGVQLGALPRSAAWVHQGLRTGFEMVHVERTDEGHLLAGCTAAAEGGQSWFVAYIVRVDAAWRTCSAEVRGGSDAGSRSLLLESDTGGSWTVDGRPAPYLDGCVDVDLESSVVTNTLPIHRLGLRRGETASAPAAYVRAAGLQVERLDQTYTRTDDDGEHQRYDYAAPAFDFACELVYDAAGLVLSYPGIAVRHS